MPEIVKTCKKHGELTSEQIRTEKNGKYTIIRCKQCRSINKKKSYQAHRKERISYSVTWKKENKEHAKEWGQEHRKSNPEIYAIRSARHRKKLGTRRNKMEISRRLGKKVEDYESLLNEQNYLCAICFNPEKRKWKDGRITELCWDHNHETKQVRGFLCDLCNKMLGYSRESIDTLESAIKYLQKYAEK